MASEPEGSQPDGPEGAGEADADASAVPPPGSGQPSPPTEPPPPGDQPPPPATQPLPQPGAQPPAGPSAESRNWAMVAHISAFAVFLGIPWFVGPLIVWLLKRTDDPFVDAHGKEAVNFSLSVLIYAAALVVGGIVFGILTLGLIVIPVVLVAIALGIFWFVVTLIAAVKASSGERYEYPLTIRLVQ